MFISKQKVLMKLLVAFGSAFLFLALLTAVGLAQSSMAISMVAGNGTAGFSGDGGPAALAQIYMAEGIAVDSWGNLYIADTGNDRIRKITPDGTISTVAGGGNAHLLDGGPATSAQLYSPTDVAVDSIGNLYIADFNHDLIRKVTPDGNISTVAGGGTNNPGDGGLATSAQLSIPQSVAVDSEGNLYFTEGGWYWSIELISRVRKVTPDGVINTVAGGGTESSGDGGPATSVYLDDAMGIAIDSAGNLYIAEDNRIRKVTPDGTISTVAGNGIAGYSGDGGLATLAQLSGPAGMAVDSEGNLHIAEVGNNCIRKVTPEGVISTTLAQLNDPFDVAVDLQGNLYIAERRGNRILKFGDHTSIFTTYFPQVAVGGGWSTTFTFTNTGEAVAIAELFLTDTEGKPLVVNGQVIDSYIPTEPPYSESSFVLTIPSGGTIFLSTTALGAENEIKKGWARLHSTAASLTALATYEYATGADMQCMISVPQSQPLQYATIPVDTNGWETKAMAYAVVNPGADAISIKLALISQDGTLDSDYVVITLGPGQQTARYLHQDMPGVEVKGSLVLRGLNGQKFVAVGVSEKQGLFTTIPVIPEKAPCVPD